MFAAQQHNEKAPMVLKKATKIAPFQQNQQRSPNHKGGDMAGTRKRRQHIISAAAQPAKQPPTPNCKKTAPSYIRNRTNSGRRGGQAWAMARGGGRSRSLPWRRRVGSTMEKAPMYTINRWGNLNWHEPPQHREHREKQEYSNKTSLF